VPGFLIKYDVARKLAYSPVVQAFAKMEARVHGTFWGYSLSIGKVPARNSERERGVSR
jgi:hypothetical protein